MCADAAEQVKQLAALLVAQVARQQMFVLVRDGERSSEQFTARRGEVQRPSPAILGVLPALTIIGFGALALFPTIAAVAVFQVLRRAADYAIARPTREVLFTVVSREDRYKAKALSTPSSTAPAIRSAPGLSLCCAGLV